MPGDVIVHVVGAVQVFGVFRPHSAVLIRLHILRHLAVRVAAGGLDLRVPEHIQDQVEVMHAPVYEHAAARLRFCRERAAQPGDAAECAERTEHVVDIPEFLFAVVPFEEGDRIAEAVAHADIEQFSLPARLFRHLLRKFIVDRDGLLAENVLARLQRVHRDGIMRVIGGKDVHGVHFGVGEHFFIIGDGALDLRVFLFHGFGFFGDDVAPVLDPDAFDLRESGEMRYIGYPSAPDHTDNFLHKTTPLK